MYVSMYVCMYVCIYVCMHTYIHIRYAGARIGITRTHLGRFSRLYWGLATASRRALPSLEGGGQKSGPHELWFIIFGLASVTMSS